MKHKKISQTLRDITHEMQRIDLWQETQPSTEALTSSLPFCVDTLSFSQWLQWVMFPKVFVMIETKAALPQKSNMAVMAEQAFKTETANTTALLTLIQELDKNITR